MCNIQIITRYYESALPIKKKHESFVFFHFFLFFHSFILEIIHTNTKLFLVVAIFIADS